MKVFVGADFRGFELKNLLAKFLVKNGYETEDLGAYEYAEGDDFNDPAVAVALHVRENPGTRGILVCGSGHGMTMQANRFKGIRAVLCDSIESVTSARISDDANVLCLSADRLSQDLAEKITLEFLKTVFEPLERRVRRMNRLDEREDYD